MRISIKDIQTKPDRSVSVSVSFKCSCGNPNDTWISEGALSAPCPICDRRYYGKYNSKKYTIEALEVEYIIVKRPSIFRRRKK